MALKVNQNAILSGFIDSFCLICESLITGDDEVRRHISLRDHRKNLESTQLVEKFKDDQILKVKKGYYCMLCNLIFTTLTKVSLHVVEKGHKTSKGSNLLKRVGSLISFGDVVIDEPAWQGIVGEMCAVCNAEFEDEVDHLASSLHALNLVKNEVEFHDGHIYRKIDDTTFQCITCNTVLPLSHLATHFDESEHNLLLKRLNDYKLENFQKPSLKDTKDKPKLTRVNDISSISSGSEGFNSAEGSSDESVPYEGGIDLEIPNKEANKSKILESVTVFEKNEVNINFESETALCKKCLGNVDFDFKSIETHIEEHLRNPKKRDVGYVPFPCKADIRTHEPKSNDTKPQLPAIAPPINKNAEDKNRSCLDKNHNEIASKPEMTETSKKEDNEPLNENPAEFAKQNKLTYNFSNNNAYCRLCSARVPASLRSMKEHVAGLAHRSKLGQSSSSTSTSSSSSTSHKMSIRKMPLEDYLDEVFTINNLFLGTVQVVNEKFCIGATSFHLITVNGDRLRCQVCELFMSRSEMSSHVKSFHHERQFNMVPVITSFSTEFVREVRPGIFHCGFCNMMEASLEALQVHFQSSEHKGKKEAAAATLARHRPALAEYRQQQFRAQLFEAMRSGLFRRF